MTSGLKTMWCAIRDEEDLALKGIWAVVFPLCVITLGPLELLGRTVGWLFRKHGVG